MNPGDKARFANAIEKMALVFDAAFSELRLEAYWEALDDLPIEAVEDGIRSATRNCAFLPVPINIRHGGKPLKPGEDLTPPYLLTDAEKAAIGWDR